MASCNCRNRERRSGGCHSHFSEVLAYKVMLLPPVVVWWQWSPPGVLWWWC